MEKVFVLLPEILQPAAHQNKVTSGSLHVFDVVAKHNFVTESQFMEDPKGGSLRGHHLYDNVFDASGRRKIVKGARHQQAQSLALIRSRNNQSQLSYVPFPSEVGELERPIGYDRFIRNRDQPVHGPLFHLANALLDGIASGQISSKAEPVFLGERPEESEGSFKILSLHGADEDILVIL